MEYISKKVAAYGQFVLVLVQAYTQSVYRCVHSMLCRIKPQVTYQVFLKT